MSLVRRFLHAVPQWLLVAALFCVFAYLFGFFSELGADYYYETLEDDACGSGKEGGWL